MAADGSENNELPFEGMLNPDVAMAGMDGFASLLSVAVGWRQMCWNEGFSPEATESMVVAFFCRVFGPVHMQPPQENPTE